MQLRVLQNTVARFNLLSNDKNFSFTIALCNDNEVIKEGEVKAMLHYYGEPEVAEYDIFENPLENLDSIFEHCYSYATKVISTTPYESCCLLFARLYTEHRSELDADIAKQKTKSLLEQIAKLQNQLQSLQEDGVLPSIQPSLHGVVSNRIADLNGLIQYQQTKMSEYKQDSEGYKKGEAICKKYQDKIDALQQYL